VIVERLANGGLLMLATTQTFDVENPVHMAAARAMAAAIAPLNALPWAERARARAGGREIWSFPAGGGLAQSAGDVSNGLEAIRHRAN
jgi:hypothetical protein